MKTLLLLLSLLISGLASAAESIGGMVTQAQLTTAIAEITAGHQPWSAAWTTVKNRCGAGTGLAEAPSAVASYVVPAFADDPVANEAAKVVLRNDVNSAFACALKAAIGVGLTGPEITAASQKAQDLINDWANVNTSVSGSGSEVEEGQLIFSYVASAFMSTAEVLSLDATWTAGEKTQFTSWVDSVWDTVYGDIQDRTNNWGSWASFLGIAASQWKGNTSERATRITRLKAQMDLQIQTSSPLGAVTLELQRDNGDGPVWYSQFALMPMSHAAWVVYNTTGEDLFHYTPPSGGTLLEAMTFFYALVQNVHLADATCACDASTFDPPDPNTWAGQLLFANGKIYDNATWVAYGTTSFAANNGAWKKPDLLIPTAITVTPPTISGWRLSALP